MHWPIKIDWMDKRVIDITHNEHLFPWPEDTRRHRIWEPLIREGYLGQTTGHSIHDNTGWKPFHTWWYWGN